MRNAARTVLALAGLVLVPTVAQATWSIILVDTRTGEVAVGSATCLTNFDLRAGTPVLIPGVGAATAQSFVDSTGQNRVYIRDRLSESVAPTSIITQLATFDSGHQTRQYGIVDALGRTATFSGTGAGAWAGGRTGSFLNAYAGQVGPVAYAIQGNVLTGSPVVDQAVQAAISVPGDLPTKLMAAMQAARVMGGDGRCSCSAGAPTSCGSPPPTFTKSAHIAYMLIARAGDREGSNGIYRSGSQPLSIAAADLTGDARPELLAANFSGNSVSIITNTTPASGAVAPRFASLPTNIPTGAGPRGLGVADLTGDTIQDIVTADGNGNTLSLLRGLGGTAFAPAVMTPTGASPRAVAIGDFDGVNGLDVAAACFTAGAASVHLNTGAGALSPLVSFATGGGAVDIAATDLVGSPALDLAVAAKNANRIDILRGNGDGTFTPDQTIATSATPIALVAADFDGDALTDLAVACDSGQSVQVFRNTGAGFTMASLGLGFIPTDLAAGRFSGGARADLFALGSARFATLLNNGAGVFVLGRSYTIAGTATGALLGDLDGDGDLDAALANGGLAGAMTVKNDGPVLPAGTFNDGAGCATGDYFMNFNIAFQSAASPDPVAQLQTLFDPWRTNLVGRPDAVQTLTAISPPQAPSTGGAPATLTIALRDWRGVALPGAVNSVTVEPVPPILATVGPAQHQGGGIYTAQITAGATPGIARFRVLVNDGIRPVVLMPDPAFSIFAGACYANCDGSTEPQPLTAADFSCFLNRFAAGDPYANCDGSTAAPTLNAADFGCYINRFNTGCP